MRLCYSCNGGSFRNIIKHLPLENMPNHPFRMLYRKKDGVLDTFKGMARSCRTGTVLTEFDGGEYNNLSINTFAGMCGATLISETRGSVISGVHLGGKTGTPFGCYGVLTQGAATKAISELRNLSGVVITGCGNYFPQRSMGHNTLKSGECHFKSPVRYLPENSQITYYGCCEGTSTSRTSVTVTPISHTIMEVCDQPNIWGAPRMKPEWDAWQKCLANMSHVGKPFPYELLDKAIQDYIEPLETRIDDWCISPLSDKVNINGDPGVKFIDSIKLGTAVGYPLTGIKREYLKVDTPGEIEFTDEIMEEIRACESKYKLGERAYVIAKASKKDEVVSKDKCRIFYGNPLTLTFLIRKYYLPIVRFIQMNPLLAECAVGVNCHGPEWEELHNHIFKYAEDGKRLVGGDYSKYDQKLPTQLILSALYILIRLAKKCNYTQEDITVMESMCGDIVYALIAVNGDLIGIIEGAHISGNSLTVIINGIAGSLNARCFWYSENINREPFREGVSFLTYGDDNIGSVAKGRESFNIKNFSKFLAEYGQIYTMPQKDVELQEWLDILDFEFLKRKSNFIPELGVHIGALDEKSIFKSLHCYLRDKKSPHTPLMACAINIDGALREWFNHGKTVYDIRLAQMRKVAEIHKISHMCEDLNVTYEDRVEMWKSRYLDDE